jgi:hypothetical protein
MAGDAASWRACRNLCFEPLQQLPNPLAEMICSGAQDRMHYLIVLVIAVFMATYLGLGFMRLS